MSGPDVLAALEAAGRTLLAPPQSITKDQLREAESIFMNFRKLGSPYQICKEILETSQNEFVLFEAAVVLLKALMNEWSTLNPDDIQLLKNYLLQYLIHKQVPSSVLEKVVKVLSVIVRWQSVEDGGASCHALLQEAKVMIKAGNASSIIGCSLFNGIIQEFTIHSKADIIPSDKRSLIKRQFESNEFIDITSFTIQALIGIKNKGAAVTQNDIVVSEKMLLLLKSLLFWGHFSYVLLLSSLLSDSERKSQPEAWISIITDENLFNMLSVMGSHGEPLLSPVLQCLEQLTYVIAGYSDIDKENALRLIRALFPLLGAAPSPSPASALNRLVINFSRHLLSLPLEDLMQFLTTLLAYIEHLIRLSALEEAHTLVYTGTDEENGWKTGLESALDAWVQLLHVAAPQLHTSRIIKPVPPAFYEGSSHIFDALLKVRLAPPDGTRHAGAENETEIEEEGSDIERFEDLLKLAGALGRAAPDHTLPLLCRLLENRTAKMQELFLMGASHELCSTYEDLHWIILFAAHVLTQDGEGEVPAIPGELVRYSVSNTGELNASLQILATPQNPPNSEDIEKANPIVRLIAGIWRMSWIAGWGAGQWVASPTLGATVTWFLRRWARAYWLPDDRCTVVSGKPGPVLRTLWGRGTPADVWATERMALGALSLLRSLPGDPAPSQHAVALLRAAASIDNQGCAGIAHIWEAVKWGIGAGGIGLSEEVRRSLAATAGTAIATLPESEQSANLGSILDPANMALSSSNTAEFQQAIDIFTGLAEGCQTKSANCIWEKLQPAFLATTTRMRSGEHITRNGLRLAAATVAHLPQNMLSQAGGVLLVQITELVHVYAGRPIMQFNNSAHANDAEDDFCDETNLVMEIVSELVAKGYDDVTEKGNKEGMEAVFEGIYVILPRMIPPSPLLQRPTIMKCFYKLLYDFGPHIICSLSDECFNIVIQSITDGLEAPSDNDAVLMCKLVSNFSRHAQNKVGNHSRILSALPIMANRLVSAAATGALHSHLGLSASTYFDMAHYLPNIPVPPELATIVKNENMLAAQQKAAFLKYFTHLNACSRA